MPASPSNGSLPERLGARKHAPFLRDSIAEGFDLIAPPLFDYETESVIQYLLFSNKLDVATADDALARLKAINIRIISHAEMIKRARVFARQFHQPKIYDSLYAALAELRGCEFWTADKAFYDAVKHELVFVKYLPTYGDENSSAKVAKQV